MAVSDTTALVANSQATVSAAIQRLAGSGDRLSDTPDFQDTLATLPSDNIVVGYAPGGGYDIYARSLARHMARHIPGNPTIVVQNMPGAGSIKAANYLYNIAPKDGTSFGGFSRGAFLGPYRRDH